VSGVNKGNDTLTAAALYQYAPLVLPPPLLKYAETPAPWTANTQQLAIYVGKASRRTTSTWEALKYKAKHLTQKKFPELVNR
jgi:hypothetical protein